MPKRTHVSMVHDDAIILHPVSQDDLTRWHKPNGFWYEVDGDWQRWVTDEGFFDLAKVTVYDVNLKGVNLLRLNTAEKLFDFNAEYGMPALEHNPEYPMFHNIDWPRVAERYDGIEIAPYQWRYRMDMMWYYSWDCASGVIWEPRDTTVTRAKVTEKTPTPRR